MARTISSISSLLLLLLLFLLVFTITVCGADDSWNPAMSHRAEATEQTATMKSSQASTGEDLTPPPPPPQQQQQQPSSVERHHTKQPPELKINTIPDFLPFPRKDEAERFWEEHPSLKGVPDMPKNSTNYPSWLVKLLTKEEPNDDEITGQHHQGQDPQRDQEHIPDGNDPSMEHPNRDNPRSENPRRDNPNMDNPRRDSPNMDNPRSESPNRDNSNMENSRMNNPNIESPNNKRSINLPRDGDIRHGPQWETHRDNFLPQGRQFGNDAGPVKERPLVLFPVQRIQTRFVPVMVTRPFYPHPRWEADTERPADIQSQRRDFLSFFDGQIHRHYPPRDEEDSPRPFTGGFNPQTFLREAIYRSLAPYKRNQPPMMTRNEDFRQNRNRNPNQNRNSDQNLGKELIVIPVELQRKKRQAPDVSRRLPHGQPMNEGPASGLPHGQTFNEGPSRGLPHGQPMNEGPSRGLPHGQPMNEGPVKGLPNGQTFNEDQRGNNWHQTRGNSFGLNDFQFGNGWFPNFRPLNPVENQRIPLVRVKVDRTQDPYSRVDRTQDPYYNNDRNNEPWRHNGNARNPNEDSKDSDFLFVGGGPWMPNEELRNGWSQQPNPTLDNSHRFNGNVFPQRFPDSSLNDHQRQNDEIFNNNDWNNPGTNTLSDGNHQGHPPFFNRGVKPAGDTSPPMGSNPSNNHRVSSLLPELPTWIFDRFSHNGINSAASKDSKQCVFNCAPNASGTDQDKSQDKSSQVVGTITDKDSNNNNNPMGTVTGKDNSNLVGALGHQDRSDQMDTATSQVRSGQVKTRTQKDGDDRVEAITNKDKTDRLLEDTKENGKTPLSESSSSSTTKFPETTDNKMPVPVRNKRSLSVFDLPSLPALHNSEPYDTAGTVANDIDTVSNQIAARSDKLLATHQDQGFNLNQLKKYFNFDNEDNLKQQIANVEMAGVDNQRKWFESFSENGAPETGLRLTYPGWEKTFGNAFLDKLRKRVNNNWNLDGFMNHLHHLLHHPHSHHDDNDDQQWQRKESSPVTAVPRANSKQISYTARYRYRFGIYPGYTDYKPNVDSHHVYYEYHPNHYMMPDAFLPFRG